MPVTAALRALEAGDHAGAEANVRHLLAQHPADPSLLRLLATICVQQNKTAAAEEALKKWVAVSPAPEALSFLADVQYRLHAYADCEATLERIVDMGPATLAQFRLLAKVKGVNGKGDEAREVLRRALDQTPDDVELMVSYGDMFAATPDRACAALEAFLPRVAGNHAHTSYLLKRITLHRARANRMAAGLKPDFAASWAETCAWPDPEGLGKLHQALVGEITSGPSARGGAYLDLACVALLFGNWTMAESFFAHVRDNMRDPIADCSAFGAAFHGPLEALTHADIVNGLAAVEHVLLLSPQTGATMFLASDYGYFERFTLSFVRSLEAAGITADVQIHLLDGTPAEWSAAAQALSGMKHVRIGLSAEASGAKARGTAYARLYYHAVRFIRLYEEVLRTRRATWILDADVNFLRDPNPTLHSIAGFDLAIRGNPSSFEPTLKLTAGCVGIAPTPLGLEYARRVAAYIAHWKAKDRWSWGVDQIALYSCYARMSELKTEPATRFLGNDVICKFGDTDSVFEFPTGIQKYAQGQSKS